MRAVVTKVVAELRRRRLQAALIGIIVVLASGTATIALTLIAEASHPYDRAFEDQRGAHLVAFFNARRATSALVAGTQQLLGASAAGGPWLVADVPFKHGSGKYTLTVVGRGDPGGRVEVLRLTAGRWVKTAGEIVVTRSFAEQNAIALGDQITALSVRTEPTFRVVGEAIDINEGPAGSWSQSAWVIPDQVDQLVISGDAMDFKMAYRFHSAPTADQIGRDITKLKMALQPGALTDTVSYLDVRDTFNRVTAAILIFLLAFSVFALGAVALIIANVVTGAVIGSYREIGIMKALGFTPLQVVQSFVAQMAGPALAGCLVGILIGGLLSQPLLNQSTDALGLPSGFSFAPWIPIVAVSGVLVIVVIAAVTPAWRAAVLNPASAISLGTSPRIRGRSGLGRLLNWLGLMLRWDFREARLQSVIDMANSRWTDGHCHPAWSCHADFRLWPARQLQRLPRLRPASGPGDRGAHCPVSGSRRNNHTQGSAGNRQCCQGRLPHHVGIGRVGPGARDFLRG